MSDDLGVMNPNPVSESQVETMHIVQPAHANSMGTIFGGQLVAWVDLAAAICARRHARRTCVTASIDELHFLAPVRIGDVVILKAAVNYTHRTSLEVGVKVESENPATGEKKHTASAYLTFVALNEKGRPTEVAPVLPQSPDERRRFEEAKRRRELRLQHREERKKLAT